MPTLYLTNVSKRSQHGPGRRLSAMALPKVPSHHGDGKVPNAMPNADALRAVQKEWITEDEYRDRCVNRFGVFASIGRYAPGNLRAVIPASKSADGRAYDSPVADSDTLFCSCACPDSPLRKHSFCHLELLAPFLVAAGWDVVLYGKPFNPTNPE